MSIMNNKIFAARARPRHQPGSMNKLEGEYSNYLKLMFLSKQIEHYEFEPVKFRLAANTYYTPDFLVIRDGLIEIHEVKGFWEDDARVKIKCAADKFWYFLFVAVTKQNKEWQYEYFNNKHS